ncbi:hypothetical protein [Streptomyces sp. NBC_00525]|uniref:hypothetical protein n=1 Tax=Streptomyces sp. NBC_00525 TaxID=2903660 RepID=UPI002E808D58|nr:hypothetical protein [Streptomyces sp. NBC_00525]WUC92166.1 hypothetical protein OG710_00435 [Streptomyces sp. NBC_00525]
MANFGSGKGEGALLVERPPGSKVAVELSGAGVGRVALGGCRARIDTTACGWSSNPGSVSLRAVWVSEADDGPDATAVHAGVRTASRHDNGFFAPALHVGLVKDTSHSSSSRP